MAFEIHSQHKAKEGFWKNIDNLQRILYCFSKSTIPSEINFPSHLMEDQSKEMNSTIRRQRNFDSQCIINEEIILKKIDNIFQNFVDKYSSDGFGFIQIPNRKLWKNTSFEINKGIQMIANPTLKTIGVQRKDSERKSGNLKTVATQRENSEEKLGNFKNIGTQRLDLERKSDNLKAVEAISKRFEKEKERKLAMFLLILLKIYKLILMNLYRTKRDIFYEDVSLFVKQKTVDDILDDIACLLQTPKVKLHVLTSSKGCISGNLRYKESDGSYVDCNECSQGVLISHDVDGIEYIQSDARFILVVEKDAVFQFLLDCNITESLHPCIIITGKGFPDVNTREMVRKLWNFLKIPVFGLVDADPYGVEILCIYKYGSKAMSFDVEKLAVPELYWLGLLPSEIARSQFPKSATIPLTEHDRKKLAKLLERPYIQNNVQWQCQIEILREKSFKAELEGLSKIRDDYLPNRYIPDKIRYGGWK